KRFERGLTLWPGAVLGGWTASWTGLRQPGPGACVVPTGGNLEGAGRRIDLAGGRVLCPRDSGRGSSLRRNRRGRRVVPGTGRIPRSACRPSRGEACLGRLPVVRVGIHRRTFQLARVQPSPLRREHVALRWPGSAHVALLGEP